MSGMSLFNHPLLLGFEIFEQRLEQLSKTQTEGYPPYNIEQIDPGHLRITVAVAGFSEDDLSIQLEESQLLIRGKRTDEAERAYLHRGSAARQFQRSFILADRIEVEAATLDNGLLHIDLVRPEPESLVRTIPIIPSGTQKGGR